MGLWHGKREITKEQYERAMGNRGYLEGEDLRKVFSESERMGYGVYSPLVYEEGGAYYVGFDMGTSCD